MLIPLFLNIGTSFHCKDFYKVLILGIEILYIKWPIRKLNYSLTISSNPTKQKSCAFHTNFLWYYCGCMYLKGMSFYIWLYMCLYFCSYASNYVSNVSHHPCIVRVDYGSCQSTQIRLNPQTDSLSIKPITAT